MKIYKERQFLIFDFEDGKTVKYDFATKKCYGKSGREVTGLHSQLRGLTISELCDCCTDKQYGKFLRFVKDRSESRSLRRIDNIGTILSRVPDYARYEQIFSAGIDDIVDRQFSYAISDIPKSLIKLCKTHQIKLSNDFLNFYKENIDGYLLAYNLDYTSLTDNDIYSALVNTVNVKEYWGTGTYQYRYVKKSTLNLLISEYGYTMKALMNYMDYIKTFEAIEGMHYILTELYDYANMMSQISNKFDKYPRHLLTTHRIATRNYNRLMQEFSEEKFKARIDKSMEKTFDDYKFIYPSCTQDIKDEAVQQNNCVASYIDKVIDGACHILFLRYKDSPDKSLVTIEVRNGKIVQALQRYNTPLTKEQQEVVNKYNLWYSKKLKGESEETEYVD